jgi:hypothetical protein
LERFTERGRRVVVLAQDVARALEHDYRVTSHGKRAHEPRRSHTAAVRLLGVEILVGSAIRGH